MSQATSKGIVLAAAVFACVILIPWAIKSLFGLAAVWSGLGDVRNDRIASGLLLIVIGVAGMGLLVMGQSEIILDQVGIHSRSPFFGENVIAWNDPSHFERFYNGRAVTTMYFI